MTPGPFDALSSLSHLETSSLQASPRDNGSDHSFAQHLSPPPTTERRAEREAPRESTHDAQRDEKPVSNSPSNEPPRQAEQGARSTEPKQEAAPQSDRTTSAQQEVPAPPSDAAATKAASDAKQEREESEQDDMTDATDEVLLTACVAPVAVVPVAKEESAGEGEPPAEAVLVDEVKQVKPQPAKTGKPATKQPANGQDVLPGNAALEPDQETSATATEVQPVVVQSDIDVPVEVVSEAATTAGAPSATETSNARWPQRGKAKADKGTSQVTEKPATSETTEVEIADKLAAEQSAPKSREERKERARGEGHEAATPKELAEQAIASASSATTETKASEAATIDALPTPADPSAPSSSAPPPSSTGNSTTPPTLSENVSAASRLPQHLVARTSTRASSGAPVTSAEQMRMVQRVAKAFQAAQSREDGEIRLRLSPPELGSLKLELKLQGGVMTARVEAETASAKAILLEHLPTLKERLAEQGIQVEKFDVDVMDRRPPDQGQADSSPHRERQASARLPRTLSGGRELPTAEISAPTNSGARTNTNDGRLNVTV